MALSEVSSYFSFLKIRTLQFFCYNGMLRDTDSCQIHGHSLPAISLHSWVRANVTSWLMLLPNWGESQPIKTSQQGIQNRNSTKNFIDTLRTRGLHS